MILMVFMVMMDLMHKMMMMMLVIREGAHRHGIKRMRDINATIDMRKKQKKASDPKREEAMKLSHLCV